MTYTRAQLDEAVRAAAVEGEREECARVLDVMAKIVEPGDEKIQAVSLVFRNRIRRIAAAIRARGETK